MRDSTGRRLFAFIAVAIMLAVPLAAFNASDGPEETDGAVASFALGFVLGATIFGTVGYFAGVSDAETEESQAQTGEANALATGIGDYGKPAICTSFANYANVWPLTQEHWTRQAEIRAAAEWSRDRDWSDSVADDILVSSSIYQNEVTMLANAAAQWNSMMETAADRIHDWGSHSQYENGKLKLVLNAGGHRIDADSRDVDVQFFIGSAVRDVQDGRQAVFYAGGPIYSSSACVMTGTVADGHTSTIRLRQGWNTDLPDVGSFADAGIYQLPSGNSYCGYFQGVEGDGASLCAGMAAVAGSETLFITWNGYQMSTTGRDSISELSLRVVADSGTSPSAFSIRDVLESYHGLMKEIDATRETAVGNARVMWSVYTDLGESNAYWTSLAVPKDDTEGVGWTDEQLRLINYLAMDQIAGYYSSHSQEVAGMSFEMSKDSMTLCCRGTIEVPEDSALASETGGGAKGTSYAFTPVMLSDQRLKVGTNTTSDVCYVVIWGECASLGGFEAADFPGASIMTVSAGTRLNIAEMMHDGEPVRTMDLAVKKIDWVEPQKPEDPNGPIDYAEENDTDVLIRLVCFLIGAVLLFFGFTRGSGLALIAGIVLIGIGWFLAEPIETMLEESTQYRWLMPW